MYLLPKEIKSRSELYNGIALVDVLIATGFMFMMNKIDFLVHPKWQIAYYILNLVTIGLLLKNTFTNPIRKGFQRIIFLIIQNRRVYSCEKE